MIDLERYRGRRRAETFVAAVWTGEHTRIVAFRDADGLRLVEAESDGRGGWRFGDEIRVPTRSGIDLAGVLLDEVRDG